MLLLLLLAPLLLLLLQQLLFFAPRKGVFLERLAGRLLGAEHRRLERARSLDAVLAKGLEEERERVCVCVRERV